MSPNSNGKCDTTLRRKQREKTVSTSSSKEAEATSSKPEDMERRKLKDEKNKIFPPGNSVDSAPLSTPRLFYF